MSLVIDIEHKTEFVVCGFCRVYEHLYIYTLYGHCHDVYFRQNRDGALCSINPLLNGKFRSNFEKCNVNVFSVFRVFVFISLLMFNLNGTKKQFE